MADIAFADLVEIYRHTRFEGIGEGALTIANERIAQIIRKIEADPDLYDLTQISLATPTDPTVGSDVRINVAAPSLALGILAEDFNALFRAPGAAFNEPQSYYVVNPGYASGDEPAPETIVRYRALLSVVNVLRRAASYVVELQREMVFIGDEKIVVPVSFTAANLPASLPESAQRLVRIFDDPLHGEEKTSLLEAAVIEITSTQRRDKRFSYLIANLERVCQEVERGYRLFVSSFSYSKIKKEVETARLDYIGRIHKTIVDIQGQLLGIPVATIVVASQLKHSARCDVAFWTNSAVLLGAWIFVGLLWLAVKNQRHTLAALKGEIDNQRHRLSSEYAAIRSDFIEMFDDLDARISWHRKVLIGVTVLALAGAGLATIAYFMLTEEGSAICLLHGA